jgi:hypothetical protein
LQAAAQGWTSDLLIFLEITAMTDLSDVDAILADLHLKVGKRRDVAGYAANVAALQARIVVLEAQRSANAQNHSSADVARVH